MIPIRDENPHFLTPYATYAIVALNVLAWALLQGLGSEPALVRSVCTLGLIPGELLHRLPAGTQVPMGPGIACVISIPWNNGVTSGNGWTDLRDYA